MTGGIRKTAQCKICPNAGTGSSNDVPTNATTGQNTVATTNGESPEADVARGVVSKTYTHLPWRKNPTAHCASASFANQVVRTIP